MSIESMSSSLRSTDDTTGTCPEVLLGQCLFMDLNNWLIVGDWWAATAQVLQLAAMLPWTWSSLQRLSG